MFRLAVFNVLSHNRDDHGKNFSFLMNEQGEWRLAPAYDLTFSSGPRGHQSTMVMGEGETPSFDHLLKLGAAANLKKDHINRIIEQTIEALKKWKGTCTKPRCKQSQYYPHSKQDAVKVMFLFVNKNT